jgi:hypothetical protein
VILRPSGDAFGIREIYPSAPKGMSWSAHWDHGALMEDPWLERGSDDVHYDISNGVLYITGATSRLYVRDPAKKRQWHDVEVTVYAKRVADDGVPYSGIVTGVRINHGMTGPLEENLCDSRGLTARLRFDGSADFGKETSHPTTVATDSVPVFPDGMPYGEWIGYKHVVYDIPGGTRQELWMDLTDGRNGGDWKLIDTHEDLGGTIGEVACAPGIDPTIPYVNGPRVGSESGLPSLSILFRVDGLARDGMLYKWASVREIDH